jgi:hypothetical protein
MLVAACCACGGTSVVRIDGGAVDAGVPDAGAPDSGIDAGLDAGTDAGLDAGPADAGIDAGFDAGVPDAGIDAGPDAGTDAGPDGGGFCLPSTPPTTLTMSDCSQVPLWGQPTNGLGGCVSPNPVPV